MRNSINQATQVAPSQVYFNQLLRHPDEVEDSRSSMDPAETESFFTYHKKAIHNQEKYVKKYEGESFQKLHPVGPIYLREKDPRESTLDMGIAQFERDLLSLIGTLSKLGTKKLILVPPPSIVGRSNHRKAFENARRKVEEKCQDSGIKMNTVDLDGNETVLSRINATEETETAKPEIITFYNQTKGGVDTQDKMLTEYTVKRKTWRWPLALFFNMIDVTALAAYIIITENLDHKTSEGRRKFLKELSKELCIPAIGTRSRNVRSRICIGKDITASSATSTVSD
ncbi:hypothetical protein WDU94_001810 [Cyamophila willieti]